MCVLVFVVLGTRRNNRFQSNVMKCRDSRMKATNDINYMLHVLNLCQCCGYVVHPSTYINSRIWHCTLIGTFPQSMISISQAMISLGSLDRYMMSRELVEEAAKRDEACDSSTAVEVKNGPFSCDDESKEEDLKHINLNMLGSSVFCISTVFMFLLPSSIIKPENVGLTLSYGLPLNGVLFWAIYMSCFVENKMVSVERIKQFTNIPSEAAWERKDLQVVSSSKTCSPSIHGGEKIGVVGRTGSGKSTLIQVFFRLVEPSGGKIIIDGIDITTIRLHDIRSRFGIIPQEPVLFEGIVRSNIDPP
ncbi:unnamed protein product [Prunus brigantina]